MEEMRKILVDAVIKLRDYSTAAYNDIEFELHKIAHNGELGEDLAKEWVKCMENKDGTKGAHWSMEQTSQIFKEKKIEGDASTWYAVMNMMYSDYFNPRFDTNIYVDLAKDWLGDKDAGPCKTLKYYYYVIH